MIDEKKYIEIKTKGVDMIFNQVIQGGGSATIQTLNVTPQTTAQTITASGGVDGYSPVNVAAVTSSIDANIIAGNIKYGVTILGVTGSYSGSSTIDSLTITPTTSEQVITATGGVDGYSPITVNAVTSSIDANITSGNIKSGVSILGVTGSVVELNGTTTSINPSTSAQTVTPTSPNNGFTEVTVPAVTSSIDANIVAGNIKDGVSILGVLGTYTGGSAPQYYLEKAVNSSGKLISGGTSIISFNGVKDVGDYQLNYAYAGNTQILGAVDLSSLENISGTQAMYQAFQNCTGLTSVDLSGLKQVTGYNGAVRVFNGCTGITTADLSSLEYVNNIYGMFEGCSSLTTVRWSNKAYAMPGSSALSSMFKGCIGLTSFDFSMVISAEGSFALSSIFEGCTNLTSVNISHLAKLGTSSTLSNTFKGCTSLTELRFNNLAHTATNLNAAFPNMLSGCSGVTVHFPSDWATDMASWANVTAGFGGTNTTVLWDLPAVTTLDMSNVTTGALGSADTGALGNLGKNNYFDNITSVNLSGLVDASTKRFLRSAFEGCTNLTSVNLSSLETISGAQAMYNAFYGCTGLTSVDLSSLTTISGPTSASDSCCYGMFSICTGLASIDLSSLTVVSGTNACQYMLSGCTGLTSLSFPSLTTVSGNGAFNVMCYGCTNLSSVSFPSLRTYYNTNVFSGMLSGVTGCTVHLPSTLSGSGLSFGGTDTTVLFDLPATNTLTGADTVTYTRNPKYDTGTALAWKVGAYGTTNFTPAYYTSGLTDPTVGTTIYSDAACTTAVTTVDSIA